MDAEGNLAIGKAHEPQEDACQPLTQNMPPSQKRKNKRDTAVVKNGNADTQTSNTHKEALSQPAAGLSQLQKLLWLQTKRTAGLWAQCDECDRWRYLPNVLDRHELPTRWFCRMNPDSSLAKCSEDETPITLHEEEDLIHGEYAAGSLVAARWPGRSPAGAGRSPARAARSPAWPAMVDDCPDTEQYYWLDGFSDIPTHYNVVFFDRSEVTRAWIDPAHLQPYSKCKNVLKSSLRGKAYRRRLEVAISQADDAETLSLPDRLKKYSFIARYKGTIGNPKIITEKFYQRYRNQFKRKYNIEPPNELSDSDNESNDTKSIENGHHKDITIGSKKRNLSEENNTINKSHGAIDNRSSLDAQLDPESTLVKGWFDNGASSTNTDTNDQTNTIYNSLVTENRTRSPASDDFDF